MWVVVFILLILISLILITVLTGCSEPNYFEQQTTETVIEKTTCEVTSTENNTEEPSTHVGVFPDGIWDYDVQKTPLVP